MKKIASILFTIIIFCLYTSCLFSQVPNEREKTNLFVYGDSLTTTEVNLRNFIKNFPLLISNAKDFDSLSYKYIGKIKNRKEAKQYAKENLRQDKYSGVIIEEAFSIYEPKDNKIKIHFGNIDIDKISEKQLNTMIEIMANEYINIGDEVYEFNFITGLRPFKYYFFVKPDTKQVLMKGNIFGVEIYRFYADSIVENSNSI